MVYEITSVKQDIGQDEAGHYRDVHAVSVTWRLRTGGQAADYHTGLPTGPGKLSAHPAAGPDRQVRGVYYFKCQQGFSASTFYQWTG